MTRRLPTRNDAILAACGLALYVPAIGRYGLKLLALLPLSILVGYAVERGAAALQGKRPDVYGIPVWILLPLAFPPALPLWMSLLSLAFALVITAVFFGGYGHQPASPIAVGGAFAALSFPSAFGFGWSFPFPDALTGFQHWSSRMPTVDHPLVVLANRDGITLKSLLLGYFPQAPGMALPLLVLLLGLLLLALRVIAIRTCIGFLATYVILGTLSPTTTGFDLGASLLAGNVLFVAFLVIADTRTCARTVPGRWLVGILAGAVALLIRTFAASPDGVFYAVLFANVFAPIIDEGVLTLANGGEQTP